MKRVRAGILIGLAVGLLALPGEVRAQGGVQPAQGTAGPVRPSTRLGETTPLLAEQPAAAKGQACGKSDFEQVVEEAASALRDLNSRNRPAFQEKLRELKTKRSWSHDEFMKQAAPLVRDDKIAAFDKATDDLLLTMSTMGQEGIEAKAPDCPLLLELRARMNVLVATQTQKWAYMFGKVEDELNR